MIKFLWNSYLVHIVDVGVVTFIIYRLLLLVKGTRAMQVLWGVAFVAVAAILATGVFHFPTLGWLLRYFWVAGGIALLVIFQPEVRSALANLGRPWFNNLVLPEELPFIDELIEAVEECSRKSIGALIVLQQETGLKNIIETGVVINGEISKKLLLTIFYPRSALHDGAVIIQSNRLFAARCLLPLTNEPGLRKVLGTRHQAAVGVTEISDAWVIVVSEETGYVSVARKGELEQNITIKNLRQQLIELYKTQRKKMRLLNFLEKG
ncbi:MAG: diadenylate cyclase CdaA [Elusimicrobiota bacterium]